MINSQRTVQAVMGCRSHAKHAKNSSAQHTERKTRTTSQISRKIGIARLGNSKTRSGTRTTGIHALLVGMHRSKRLAEGCTAYLPLQGTEQSEQASIAPLRWNGHLKNGKNKVVDARSPESNSRRKETRSEFVFTTHSTRRSTRSTQTLDTRKKTPGWSASWLTLR